MRNYFTFGEYDSRDFGVFIARDSVYNAPKRAYRQVQVPGRNGDLMIDGGRFENIDVTYPCLIYSKFDANIEGLRNALLSCKGYVRIMDSYHPNEFRLGCFSDDLSVAPRVLGDGGTFDVVFNCKPQRFLLSGEEPATYPPGTENSPNLILYPYWDGTKAIYNPTLFPSKPLIRVYGYGTLSIGETILTIAQNSLSYIDIDSEIQDCYCGVSNANSYVSFTRGDFPELDTGVSGVEYSGNITSVEIIPRWFIL